MTEAQAGERAIRVFVSSTFRDMQAEREELVKRVFPVVRRRCEERGVAWSEVDLRWGVTDEQKAEGAVLPICLAEIDRSRPFFLGLLGQRYGWVPEELPSGLSDRIPWLGDLGGTSVTELEFLHGVLRDPDSHGHAFFHLRDPAYLDTLGDDERSVLGESASPEEIEALGPDGADAAAAARRDRLERLREQVRTSGHPCADYASPAELGRQVLEELLALVDRLYPADEVPDGAGREDASHRAYGRARDVGLLRPPLVNALDAHAAGDGPPLVVSAGEGAELTPQVAAWLEGHRTANEDQVTFEHHVGATADSSDWRNLARRLVGALVRGHGLAGPDPDGLPTDADGLRSAVASTLAAAGTSQKRSLLVVDGAHLLDDVDGAPDLTWLPLTGAGNVRVIVTTVAGRPRSEAERRRWPVLDVPALDAAERRAFTTSFLGRWSKGLDEVHLARLAGAPQTGDVLFLRTVLDELRQHGDHFTLGAVIDALLAATTTEDLIDLVLRRWEADFDGARPGLVRDSMTALWASRRGLTEAELADHLGGVSNGGEPLPSALWSPLVLAAESALVTRSGMLALASDVHRRAIEARYLSAEADRTEASSRLASTFSAAPLGPRTVEELPWLQLAAGDIAGLVSTIGDLRFLEVGYPAAPGDLRRLWARAEAAGRSVLDAYRPVIEDPAAHPEEAWAVARLVTDAGHPEVAAGLHRFLVDHYRGAAGGSHEVAEPARAQARLRASLVNLGAALHDQGDLTGAEAALAEAAERCRSAGDDATGQAAVGDLALVRRDRGDLAGALALFAEEEAICRRLGDSRLLRISLTNHASALRGAGDANGAMDLLTEAEEVARRSGDAQGLATVTAALAVVTGDRASPAEALGAHQAMAAVAVDAGDLRGQVEALINQAKTLRQLGRFDQADEASTEAEAAVRRMDDDVLLARVLDGRARTAIDRGRFAEALPVATEAVLTAKAAGAPQALVLALGSLGIAQREMGDASGSQATHSEELRVATSLADGGAAAATAEVNLAAVAIVLGDLPLALERYGRAEPVLRELDLPLVLVPLLNNRSQVRRAVGDIPGAIEDLLECGRHCARVGSQDQRVQMLTTAIELLYGTGRNAEAEPVWAQIAEACRETGDEAGLQRALGDGALLVMGRGDVAAAGAMLAEQEEICRRIGDQAGLAACVGNQAILRRQQGDIAGALACVDEQIEVAKASGNGQGYLFGTANRGELLGLLGRFDEALECLGEARAMAVNHGLTPMVGQLDQMIAQVRASAN